MTRKAILLAAAALAAASGAWSAPVLRWINPTHDFGAFREDMGNVTCVFKAVNTGDEPVVITDARANCGCTRPTYSKEPVAPGDTLSVSVAYNPTGRPGRFHKQVKVSTNAAGGSSILNLTGTVIGAPSTLSTRYPVNAGHARLSNNICQFGQTRKGHVLASAVNVYNTSADTIEPAVTAKPDYVNVVIRPEKVAPGEQCAMSFTAYTDRCPGYGIVEDSLTVMPDKNRPDERVTVSTVMIVVEDFSRMTEEQLAKAPNCEVSDESVDFGDISRTDGLLTRTFEVRNAGATTMIVRRLDTPDKALTVRMAHDRIKPGKSETVTVTLDPAKIRAGEEMVNARLTLITNSPDKSTQYIRVVGMMK